MRVVVIKRVPAQFAADPQLADKLSRGQIPQAAVGPVFVVLVLVGFRQIPGFGHTDKDLSVEEFVPKLAVEGLDVAVLPGGSGSHEEGLDADSFKPVA